MTITAAALLSTLAFQASSSTNRQSVAAAAAESCRYGHDLAGVTGNPDRSNGWHYVRTWERDRCIRHHLRFL
jgi:uncharacterized membrane protein